MANNKWASAAFILLFLAICAYIFSGIMSIFVSTDIQQGNVLVIPITGEISEDGGGAAFGSSGVSASSLISVIDSAEKDDSIDAVIFDVNSGGGSAVASEEIMSRIRKMNKTSVAVIREIGASGAYWISSSTDYVIANPLSFVGSIGVTSSYLEYADLLTRYNITYRRLVAGKYKDMGSPYTHLTPEEEDMMMRQMDYVKEYFMHSVSENRNISIDDVRKISEGQVFLANEAMDYGLIDSLGGMDDAQVYLAEKLNKTVTLKEYREKKTLADLLSLSVDRGFYSVGQGIGDRFLTESKKNGVLTT